jgi:hypothetical protein
MVSETTDQSYVIDELYHMKLHWPRFATGRNWSDNLSSDRHENSENELVCFGRVSSAFLLRVYNMCM